MKRYFAYIIISIFTICPLLSQSALTGVIKGSVAAEDGPASLANVILYLSKDSTMVKGEVADMEGNFILRGLTPDEYFVQITFLGYAEYENGPISVRPNQETILDKIYLSASSTLLSEVQIKAERPLIEVQPDKTVFNVDGSINATGNTALELLRKSPGVVVDNSNNIILSGKSGVRVYIDGKPSQLSSADLATQLDAMQSSEIDAIEIITNPGARYEAEGNAGIINIRLKKDKSLGGNANINAGYSIGKLSKYNATSTFNHRNKKSNFFGTYSHNDGENESWLKLYRTQGDFIYDDRTTTNSGGAYNSLKLGTDFFINDKHTWGFLVNGYLNNRDWTNNNTTPILNASNEERVSFLEAQTVNDGLRQRLNANVNYQYDNGDGKRWSIDVDWGIFRNENLSLQSNFYKTPEEDIILNERIYTADAPTEIDIYTFKLDHEGKLWDGTYEAGIKLSNVTTDNTYDFYELIDNNEVLDTDRSNNFVFTEKIGAAYFSFNRPVGKVTLYGGLRMELTHSNGRLTAIKATNNDEVDREYLDVFPSAGITYQHNRQNQFRLNFSRRIDRPSYQDLNPFEFKLSELSYSRGNPFLDPQYTNSISLSHTYNYRLTTSLSYSHTNDYFANISDSTEVIRTFLETINLDYRKVVSLSISYPFSPKEWWSTYTSLTGYNTNNQAILGPGREVNLKATVASLYHQSTFRLPRDFSFELSGWYSSPSIWGAVYETDANFSIDMGIQKKFADGRGNIKLSLTDIFNSAGWTAIQDFAGFFVDAAGGWESRQVRVNVSYLLGNNQLKKSKKRTIGLEEEAGRIN